MATGPEHYREAERMYLMSWENDCEPENVMQLLASAYDRAAEFAMDAADEERWAEENAANQYDDEHYDVDDEDEGGED